MNKELILWEKLALQSTTLANQTTLLVFLRTSMYFLVTALSLKSLLKVKNCFEIEIVLFVISLIILSLGIINYFIHKIMIFENKNNLGNYKSDYYV